MSFYAPVVDPMRRLVSHVGRVAETADPGVRVPATAAVAAPDRAATGACASRISDRQQDAALSNRHLTA